MPPKSRKSLNAKVNNSNKKGSKRKRDSSENEDDEVSEQKSQHENEPDELENQDNMKVKTENEYGKYQKYNKDKAWKLKRLAHHLLPSFNMTNNFDIKDIREFPLVKISLPHSIFVNSKFHENIDFCHRRTTALNSYMGRLKILKTAYLSAKKRSKKVRKDEKKGIYNKTLVEFAERLEFNPDKYFGRDYDFYYTGGNLCVNNRSNQIIHVAGTDMNTLVLSVLNIQNNTPKVHRLTSIDFKNAAKNECEIFEVQCSVSDDDLLFMRQRHCVSIQEFSNAKINIIQNFKTKDVPFISFTQDIINTHILAISDLVHKVRICDIEKGIPIQTLKMMPRDQIKLDNNWNMIKSLDSHVYIYAGCKKVSVIDTRLPESNWQSNYCGVSEENSCYNFCSLARSKFENLFYVGANHKAYCVDRRYMGKDIDSKNAAVACWTHQLSTFPLMMATTYHNDKEYIALQSPVNSDLNICENMQFLQETNLNTGKRKKPRTDLPPEYLYESPSLPYMPPSIENIFHEARLQGKCIKQGTGLCDRVKACITGLDFSDDFPFTYLLTATSNGDIFARQLCNPDLDIKPDTATASDVMGEFEDKIFRTLRKPPLDISEVCDLSGISKVFRCPLLSLPSQGEDFEYPTKRKFMGRWQKSIQTLSKYKDALASDLMAIWDFDLEDEPDFNIAALNSSDINESKVSGWLENTDEIAHSTMLNMTTIPLDVINISNINSEVADTSLNELEQKININAESIIAKPKNAKKKSKYIKGF